MPLPKLFPFVLFIVIGFLAGRYFKVERTSLSKLLIYFVSPLVFLDTTWGSGIYFESLNIPLLIWVVSTALAIAAYRMSRLKMPSPDSNLLAFAMGSSNSGYFGLPLAAALYGDGFLPQMVLVVMGFSLFEYTTGFYLTARSNFSVRRSLIKLFSVPAIYAFVAGILLNEFSVLRSEAFSYASVYLRGSYSFLGLAVLGLGLADISWKTFDLRFTLSAFVSRFLAWPMTAAFVILALSLKPDHLVFKTLSIVAFLPMAANGVVIATELRASPQKIAGAIAVSTVVSLFVFYSNLHTGFVNLLVR